MKQRQADESEGCKRCGTCCANGGPALHSEDRGLVLGGHIPLAHLITIRKGEVAFNPLSGRLQPVKQELVKISGVGRQWSCLFFNPEEKGCTIYDKRPTACKALQCWDTADVEALIETDTLGRLDLVVAEDPVRSSIEEQERRFPCPDMEALLHAKSPVSPDVLEALANDEVKFRSGIVDRFDLSLGEELFYFGRPLFHLFISAGASVVEADGRLVISWPKNGD